MSAKFAPFGKPYVVGDWVVQFERRGKQGAERYRVSRGDSLTFVIDDPESLADLSDVTGEAYDDHDWDDPGEPLAVG